MPVVNESRVAVILLNWNNAPRFTVPCLQSLRKLRTSAQVIPVVVDNGSTDDSLSILREYRPEIDLVVSSQNLGFSGGCNLAIDHARKTYEPTHYWLLNNDTEVEPDALQHMIDALAADASIGAVGSQLRYMDEPDRVQAFGGGWISLWHGFHGHFTQPVDAARFDYINGASVLLSKQAAAAVLPMDDRFFVYFEDADLGLRLRQAGFRLEVACDSIVYHKVSPNMKALPAVVTRYYFESLCLFFRKHAPVPFLPVVMRCTGGVLLRVMCGQWGAARAVIGGAWSGITSTAAGQPSDQRD
jgi:GT2 family glycosyltransferase